MRMVKLITGLKTEDVPLYDSYEMTIMHQEIDLRNSSAVGTHIGYAVIPSRIKHTILPVSKICYDANPDLLIAWSPEVDEYLQIPFNLFRRNIESLEKQNEVLNRNLSHTEKILKDVCASNFRLRNSFWNRFKFLFTGIIEDA